MPRSGCGRRWRGPGQPGSWHRARTMLSLLVGCRERRWVVGAYTSYVCTCKLHRDMWYIYIQFKRQAP